MSEPGKYEASVIETSLLEYDVGCGTPEIYWIPPCEFRASGEDDGRHTSELGLFPSLVNSSQSNKNMRPISIYKRRKNEKTSDVGMDHHKYCGRACKLSCHFMALRLEAIGALDLKLDFN